MPLCEVSNSLLTIVDVQERLAAAVPQPVLDAMTRAAALLLDAATLLDVPTLCTEQYPEGLGATVAAIAGHFADDSETIAKTCFSCAGSEDFRQAIDRRGRKQIVLAGMESHVCILQTAMQLKEAGLDIFVVEDAVCSRKENYHRNALQRMQQAGISITNTESVIFEWLRDARHGQFRKVSALLK